MIITDFCLIYSLLLYDLQLIQIRQGKQFNTYFMKSITIKEEEEIEEENCYDYSANVNLSYLPDDLHFVLVMPFTYKQSRDPKLNGVQPYIITFREDTTKISTIIEDLKTMNPDFANNEIYLTYRKGFRLNVIHSARDIAKELGKQTIDGLTLFVQNKNSDIKLVSKDHENSDDDVYLDECCVTNYLDGQMEFDAKKIFSIWVQIPRAGNKIEVLSVSIDPEQHGADLKNAIIKEIHLSYGVELSESTIKGLVIKESKNPIKMEESVLSQTIYDKSVVVLELDPSLQLKRISHKDYNSFLIIFKEGETDPHKFQYSEIADMTFAELYKSSLELEESKAKRDVVFGLKIMDRIIKPEDKISVADAYFSNAGKQPLNVVGKVITEKMVFYYMMPPIAEQKEFSLDELSIPKDQHARRKQCQELSTIRAKNAKIQYFQQKEHLEPILVYTAELKYEQNPGKAYVIYESLNRYLRTTQILTLDQEQLIGEWRYRYASTLLKHLRKIEVFKGIGYRGINYDPKIEKKGEIVTFKQFLSTSKSINAALTFAMKNQGSVKHIFKLEIKEGYPIKEYSEYVAEDEILLPPFCDFEVVEIIKQPKQNYQLRTYVLREIQTPRELPLIQANFLLWIDDNPKEGKQIYDKIEIPNETTILIQLLSTDELKKWLQKNEKLFKDKSANFIIISDMTRKEGEKYNEIAGIEGLREIRKYDENIPIFFYIGEKVKTQKKCVSNGVDMTKITIGNQAKEIFDFINRQIAFNH